MITIGNVAAALDDAREHALPGRAVVATNEVWRRLRDLLLKRDSDDRMELAAPIPVTQPTGSCVSWRLSCE
jgi:hypothetical protein